MQQEFPQFTTRRATVDDYEAITRLADLISQEHVDGAPMYCKRAPLLTRGEFNRWLESQTIMVVVATNQQAGVRGFAKLKIVAEDPEHRGLILKRKMHIDSIVVDIGFRNQGIAKSLITTARSIGRERGAEFVTLNVYPFNGAARALYESLGFVTVRMDMEAPL